MLRRHESPRIIGQLDIEVNLGLKMAEEATKTRMWIFDQGYWQDPSYIRTIRNTDSTGNATVTLIPLKNQPNRRANRKNARYFVSQNANVYKRTNRGFARIDPQNPFLSDNDLTLVIRKLKMTRGE